jgi:hypothetical protein
MHRLAFVCLVLVACHDSSEHSCNTVTDCPGDPTCTAITCEHRVCHYNNYSSQSSSPLNEPGDCKHIICDGNGGYLIAVAMTDLPATSASCQLAQCSSDGTPTVSQAPAGTSCGAGLVCSDAGACVGCNSPHDCPGTDTQCSTRTCDNATCGRMDPPAGTKVATGQTKGDCKSLECDGNGGILTVNDDTDVPVNTSLCVSKTCTNGSLVTANQPQGTMCGTSLVCNANGICGECELPTDCPGAGTPSACHTFTCTTHVCGTTNAADGTVCADSSDVTRCRAGACVTTFAVVKAGDGTTALSTASAQVQIEERYLTDGALVAETGNPIAMPTTVSGTNDACTIAGLFGTEPPVEGFLARSGDEHYVTLACYNAAPLSFSIASTMASATNRVVARIDAMRAVDTSTHLPASFSGGAVRAATTSDGNEIWVVGSESGSTTGGAWYTTLGADTGTQLTDAPSTMHVVKTFGSQLYGSSDAAHGFPNVFTIGSGEPTTAPQTCTALPGLPTGSGPTNEPLDFALVTVGATETLYIADSRSAASSGGIEKWTSDGTTWHLISTFDGLASGVGMYSLTAYVSGTSVIILAVSNTAAGNVVVSYTDDGASTPAPTTLATAPANTGYRGIALSPH